MQAISQKSYISFTNTKRADTYEKANFVMNLWVNDMKIIEILGDNKHENFSKIIEGCRGIIIRGGQILLSYSKKIDQYMIPGGGLEEGESLSQCCIREIAEEVGVVADPRVHFLRLDEYYNEYYFKSNYFICGHIGECDRNPTPDEAENEMVPKWVDLSEAIGIFGSYKEYEKDNVMQSGMYYREHLALCEFLKWDKENSENNC